MFMPAIRVGRSITILRATPGTLRGHQHAFSVISNLRRTQGYGDDQGDPVAEHPERQKPTSQAQESLEHPGPPPPDVGQGTTNGAIKAEHADDMDSTSYNETLPEEKASAQSGGSRSKEAVETGTSPTGGEIPNAQANLDQGRGEKTPQPKIHNAPVPGVKPGLSDAEKRDVERHNQEYERTHGKAESDPRDKVGKQFWSGTGGRQGGEQDWNA